MCCYFGVHPSRVQILHHLAFCGSQLCKKIKIFWGSAPDPTRGGAPENFGSLQRSPRPGAAPPGVWGYDVPPTFAVCTPQGVQRNLRCIGLHLQATRWPQKLRNSDSALELGNSASCTVCYIIEKTTHYTH